MSNERKTWTRKDSNYARERYNEGMSNDDIAFELGRTPVAIGVHLSKIRTQYVRAKSASVAKPRKVMKPTKAPRTLLTSFIGACAGILVGAAILHFYG